MAKAGQTVSHSGKLSENTIFQCDNDDLMAKMWELTKEKEELQEEINAVTMEIDGWLQILHCTSAAELGELMDDFSSNPTLLPSSFSILHPSSERESLAKYCDSVSRLSVHEMLDCAQGYTTGNGDLFIKFPWRPPNKPNHDCIVLLKPGPDDTYSVINHNVPPTVPMTTLEEDYLKKPQGPDGLRKFVAVMGQYTKALYSRLQQIMALESSKLLEGTSVRQNKGATTLGFLVNLRLKEHPSLMAEFVLKFDPMDVLPHTVTASPISLSSEDHIPARLQETLDEVADSMKTTTFPQVMLMLKQDRPPRSSQTTTTTTPASTASTSTSTPSDTQQGEEEQPSPPSSPVSSSSDSDWQGPLFDLGE